MVVAEELQNLPAFCLGNPIKSLFKLFVLHCKVSIAMNRQLTAYATDGEIYAIFRSPVPRPEERVGGGGHFLSPARRGQNPEEPYNRDLPVRRGAAGHLPWTRIEELVLQVAYRMKLERNEDVSSPIRILELIDRYFVGFHRNESAVRLRLQPLANAASRSSNGFQEVLVEETQRGLQSSLTRLNDLAAQYEELGQDHRETASEVREEQAAPAEVVSLQAEVARLKEYTQKLLDEVEFLNAAYEQAINARIEAENQRDFAQGVVVMSAQFINNPQRLAPEMRRALCDAGRSPAQQGGLRLLGGNMFFAGGDAASGTELPAAGLGAMNGAGGGAASASGYEGANHAARASASASDGDHLSSGGAGESKEDDDRHGNAEKRQKLN